jgi:hypothetical protein
VIIIKISEIIKNKRLDALLIIISNTTFGLSIHWNEASESLFLKNLKYGISANEIKITIEATKV